jgi:predicted Zn-dependent protease with MMP-like domain
VGRRRARYAETVNIASFEAVVDRVVEELPRWVTDQMENVAIIVESKPTRGQDPSAQGILGIYEGVPLSERGVDYFGVTPDRIVIFYTPHLAMQLNEAELSEEIRITVLHEVGHHLGLTDERLHELGWD